MVHVNIVTLCVAFSTLYCVIFAENVELLENVDEGCLEGRSALNETYLENLINQNVAAAVNFKEPVDASEFRPVDTTVHDAGHYDFVIVGAGSTGAVLANRLSEVPWWKVLLIEGGDYEDDFVDIPAMQLYARFTKYNWAYTTTPQKTSCLGMVDKKCPIPRGKGIGGTTILNGLVYSRAPKEDFNKWAEMGNPGWSYPEVLPYFLKSERSHIQGDLGYHGFKGPLPVEYAKPLHPMAQAFIDANVEKGQHVLDYNGRREDGVARTQFNIDDGRRVSTGRAFVKPVQNRWNLRVMTQSYATKVILDKKVARGVRFVSKGKIYEVRAKKQVILSGGVIGSAQLLMLSGIGPQGHLKDLGIPLEVDLPVGESLTDHPAFFGLNINTNYTDTLQSTKTYVEEYLKGYGDYTVPAKLEAVSFIKTGLDALADLELLVVPPRPPALVAQRAFRYTDETWIGLNKNVKPRNSFTVLIIQERPKSKGTLRLASKDPFVYPLIDSNFLSDPENKDINGMYSYVQWVLKLLDTKALRALDAQFAKVELPACSTFTSLSEDYWKCTIRHLTLSIYHPTGTCRMDKNPKLGVVDHKLRVHGVKNLRVADASVFPFQIGGHPSANAIMIGEKLSDLIKKESFLPFFEKWSRNFENDQ